jgi:hypothetical protein
MAWQLEEDQPGSGWVLEPDTPNLSPGPHTEGPLEEAPPSFADYNKQLEDKALQGQRAFEQMQQFGDMSRQYDADHPTWWDRLKSKGQVLGGAAYGAAMFPFSTALKGSELISSKMKGENPEQLSARMEAVNKAFQPPVGEMTPEAAKTLDIIGYPFSLPGKAGGAAAAAIGGEGWRPAGELAGDIALIVIPVGLRKAANAMADRGLSKNLTNLIQSNNKLGLGPEESASVAAQMISQAEQQKGARLALGKEGYNAGEIARMDRGGVSAALGDVTPEPAPLSVFEKMRASRNAAQTARELLAGKIDQSTAPYSPYNQDLAAQMRGPGRLPPPEGYTAGEQPGLIRPTGP